MAAGIFPLNGRKVLYVATKVPPSLFSPIGIMKRLFHHRLEKPTVEGGWVVIIYRWVVESKMVAPSERIEDFVRAKVTPSES